MSSHPVVEPFNVIVHIRVRFGAHAVVTMANAFRFERMKEALHDRVVPAVALAAHATTGTSLHERTQTDALSACPRSHVLPHHTLAARPCLGCGPDCGPRGHEARRPLARLNGAGHSPTSGVVRSHSGRLLGLRLTRPSGRVRTRPTFSAFFAHFRIPLRSTSRKPSGSHRSDPYRAAFVGPIRKARGGFLRYDAWKYHQSVAGRSMVGRWDVLGPERTPALCGLSRLVTDGTGTIWAQWRLVLHLGLQFLSSFPAGHRV